MTSAIRDGDKQKIEKWIGKTANSMSQTDSPKKKMKLENGNIGDSSMDDEFCGKLFDECCSGNQNIMHLAVGNILKTKCKNR